MKDTSNPVPQVSLPVHVTDWGATKWMVGPSLVPGAKLTFGEVIVLPGGAHEEHTHEQSDEVLYVLSGEGRMTVGDDIDFPVKPGDAVYIPISVVHSSQNDGWEPLRLLAIYSPGGPEGAVNEATTTVLKPGKLPHFEATERRQADR
jgi:oxalate decarboxylase/phosphoglucose isomerase-like protein (cupin superfamily)